MGSFHEMRATPRPRMLPPEIQKSPELQALHRWNARISTTGAPVPKEAWPAVERGRIYWASRNGQETGRTIDTHPTPRRVTSKRPLLQVLYGANRDRTGDLLLAKAVWGSMGGVGRARMPIEQGFSCSLAITGGGCFPRLLDLCLISPTKRRPHDQRRVHLPSAWLGLVHSSRRNCPLTRGSQLVPCPTARSRRTSTSSICPGAPFATSTATRHSNESAPASLASSINAGVVANWTAPHVP